METINRLPDMQEGYACGGGDRESNVFRLHTPKFLSVANPRKGSLNQTGSPFLGIPEVCQYYFLSCKPSLKASPTLSVTL